MVLLGLLAVEADPRLRLGGGTVVPLASLADPWLDVDARQLGDGVVLDVAGG